VATFEEGRIDVEKNTGHIPAALTKFNGSQSKIGIGHTRWATHGGVTQNNAHPHFATDRSFVLAQNGIVENYQDLKSMLTRKGYKFRTQTDTEVIVKLIEQERRKKKTLADATRSAFLQLTGRNTIIVLSNDGGDIIGIRNGSPLVVGVGKDELFFASDTLSFADRTKRSLVVDNNQMVTYRKGELKLADARSGKRLKPRMVNLDHSSISIDTGGFAHFMIKEIVEQKDTIRSAIQYSQKELAKLISAIRKARNVYVLGAGTAFYSAMEIAYFLRKYAGINATELRVYEAGSYKGLFSKKDLVIAVSQSGETADTIEALEFAKAKGTKVASLVNMLGSTVTKMSDYRFFTRSGPEICVASTKAFTAQISWGLLLALTIIGKYGKAKTVITLLGKELEKYFNKKRFEEIRKLVKKLKRGEHFFVLGKGRNYAIALEGALKIKEITYKHFEGFAAGELKHGVIALIEKGTPVFVIVSDDEDKDDIYSAAAQVKARGARVIGVGKKNNQLFDEFIKTPDGGLADPISNVIPFQLISYFLGVELKRNPDKPRNLAKSVTVK
jgi:glucosamine--fructose-6-phosphate aminotransferase (isomerizing)